MVHDSISPNTAAFVPDSASFFKGFVQMQDEVGSGHVRILPKGTIADFPLQRSVILQAQTNDSNMLCKSIFVPHQLQIAKKDPTLLPVNDPGWILGLLILCLLLLTFVKISFPRRLTQVFKAFVGPRNLNVLIKEGNILTERITPPLIVIQFITYTLFFYELVVNTHGRPALLRDQYLLFALLFGGVSLFYGIRFLIVRTTGWIFGTSEHSKTYMVNSLIINEVWGMGLLPLCILMFYVKVFAANYVLALAGGLFLLQFLFLLVRSFMIGLSVTKFSWLYLILYLCTVEILPLFLLGKLASDFLLDRIV
jgi:hypothetical protein